MNKYVLIWEDQYPWGEGNGTKKLYFSTITELHDKAVELITSSTEQCAHDIIYSGQNKQEFKYEPVQYAVKYEAIEVHPTRIELVS